MKPGLPTPRPGDPVDAGDIEVLLVHRPRYRDWGWPKGKAERNELVPVAAVREVEEETGYVISLGAPLTTQRYRLSSGYLKEVYYWVGEVLPTNSPGQVSRTPVARASANEIDVARWTDTDKARKILTRRGDRRLLSEILGRASRGELQTTAVVLMRHARAMSREKWGRDEATRPLTRTGVSQAIDLIPLLSAFGVGRVISSPWQRCVQTAHPYATLSSSEYSTDDYLTEDAVRENPKRSSKLVKKILEGPRTTTAISLHRPGYRALQAPLKNAASRAVSAEMDNPKPGLRKSELLVAHVALSGNRRVIAVERHKPFPRLTGS